ncbi:MAG: helix-turn-helix domain-containing protein [Candidatus Aenigmarchaeota archaeon]|nr:helix-turn-helix domain-containing protein [Candidatus Aenigmarchaeota archaeon]
MKTQCEVVVNDILPGLRAAVSRELIVQYNMNQSEVAERLGVSQPAISQYLRKLRGNKLIENKEVSDGIKQLCSKIYAGEIGTTAISPELWNICRLAARINDCPLCFSNGRK